MPVGQLRDNAITALFEQPKIVIGVVHSKALPGAPKYDGGPVSEIYDYALAEAQRYAEAGVDGLIVENHGDIPFLKPDAIGPETAACMAIMTERVRVATGLPIGVNVLANGALQALAIAQASGASFIRVNQWSNAYVANEGILEGPAAAALRYRKTIGAEAIRPGSPHDIRSRRVPWQCLVGHCRCCECDDELGVHVVAPYTSRAV